MKKRMLRLLVLGLVVSAQVQANAPVLELNMLPLSGGELADNTLLGVGRIQAPSGGGSGFQVWSSVSAGGTAPNRYELRGLSSGHSLWVQIGQPGWVVDTEGGDGIIWRGSNERAEFDIRAAGHQTVVADIYQATLTVGSLAPVQ